MKLTNCPACQNTNLRDAAIAGMGVTRFAWFSRSLWTRCTVCLSCGSVNLYLPERELETFKTWRQPETSRSEAKGT